MLDSCLSTLGSSVRLRLAYGKLDTQKLETRNLKLPRSQEHPRFFHLAELEELARGRLSQSALDYVCGGAGDELALRSREIDGDVLWQPRGGTMRPQRLKRGCLPILHAGLKACSTRMREASRR